MIPVRYWLMGYGELSIADLFNDGNFLFWQPGPDKFLPDAPSKGWIKHERRRDVSYALMPIASYNAIKPSGVKRFLKRRTKLLPRQNGELLVWIKLYQSDDVSLGLAHYRHRGPSSPITQFPTHDGLPEDLKKWLPKML